jgi:hypothetical protein
MKGGHQPPNSGLQIDAPQRRASEADVRDDVMAKTAKRYPQR